MIIKTEEEMEQLLNEIEHIKGGSLSSKSHLKNALYDWRIEKQWNKDSAKVFSYEDKGFMFISYTKREPRHCTLRHFFVLEEYRGQQIGLKMMKMLEEDMKNNYVMLLRFFANKPSIEFYEKLGYKWHGLSKTGLPFTYWNIIKKELAPLPKSQERYIV
jgi:GNAT superfamily N-acetyltransferase